MIVIFLKQALKQTLVYFLYACIQAFSKSTALASFTPHAGINGLVSALVKPAHCLKITHSLCISNFEFRLNRSRVSQLHSYV